jgi:hypothetical protein
MRIFAINVLVTALLAFGASSAGAISITLTGANGQDVVNGDLVTVTMTLDTEATVGITLLSIATLFDDSQLLYRDDLSTSNGGSGYILYDAGAKNGGNYLSSAVTCGGGYGSPTVGAGCVLSLPGQTNVDYVAGDLATGTGAGNAGVAQMATLVFQVTGTSGFASIALSQTSPGNVIGQPGGTSTTGTLGSGAGGVNIIPEPTTALLVGLGLAGLGIAGRRRE